MFSFFKKKPVAVVVEFNMVDSVPAEELLEAPIEVIEHADPVVLALTQAITELGDILQVNTVETETQAIVDMLAAYMDGRVSTGLLMEVDDAFVTLYDWVMKHNLPEDYRPQLFDLFVQKEGLDPDCHRNLSQRRYEGLKAWFNNHE